MNDLKQKNKFMDEFTIWCTEEQTKLALELSAPIILQPEWLWLMPSGNQRYITVVSDKDDRYMVKVPTAEQMIHWMEEKQGILIAFIPDLYNRWQGLLYDIKKQGEHFHQCNYVSTHKQAILDAIDAALKYLTNNEK